MGPACGSAMRFSTGDPGSEEPKEDEMRKLIGSMLLVVLGMGVTGAALAQETGSLEGRITTPEGGGIAGAHVEVVGTGLVTTTDAEGRFRFPAVPAGTHSLELTLEGQTETVDGVEVVAGETATVARELDWQLRFVDTITVFSASRRVERVVDAPAAVTVISEEQIAANAAHGQLPKLLEFTPGAEVSQSGIYDYNFNTRGFNSTLNRRVATLIDGRNPSVPFLGSQEWAAISFPLDDLASAEFVRGPSAALYGANAASGVLNLVTKSPRLSEGGALRLTGGELSTLNGDLRWAGGLGGNWYGKLVGGVRNSGDFAVSRTGTRAEYAQPCSLTVTRDCLPREAVPLDPLDDNEIWFAGARVDYDFTTGHIVTVEAGTAAVEGPVFQTGIGRVQVVDAERPWTRVGVSAPHWNVFGALSQRDAPEQTAMASGANLALDTERLQFEAQTHWNVAADRGRIVVGASYQEEDIDSRDPRTGRQTLMFAPVDSDSQAVFGQLDWNLGERWKLVLAARWDDSTLYDAQFSPKGGLVYSINPNHTLRLTYNEAFQVANYSEFFLVAPVRAPTTDLAPFEAICQLGGVSCGFASVPVVAVGNEALELEEVKTIEVGWSGILRDRAFLTLDYYNSQNENFITDLLPQLGTPLGKINPAFGLYQPPAALPAPLKQDLLMALQQNLPLGTFLILSNAPDGTPLLVGASYTNFGDVDTQGIDFGLNYYWPNGWNASFTYSWFDFDVKEAAPGFEDLLLPNSPENRLAAGVGYAAGEWDGGVNLRWVDDFLWFVGPFQGEVEAYTVVDLVGNWHVHDKVSVGLNVSNVFDDEHWETFGGDLLGRRALGSVTLRW